MTAKTANNVLAFLYFNSIDSNYAFTSGSDSAYEDMDSLSVGFYSLFWAS